MGTRGYGERLRRLIAIALVALSATAATAEECRNDVVMLRGDGGTARFRVEVADDKAERAQGLMHRETLSMSAGMLFIYPRPKRVGFWMKNTLIPLDMIFMDETGTVRKVHHEAQPHDETPIMGGNGILAVLEVNGGLSRKIGISEGWTMRHPAFDQSNAAWPCAENR